MLTKYVHAKTIGIPELLEVEYGTTEQLVLDSDSDRIKLLFPIRSRNIRARLSVPVGADVTFQDTDTLFSLDNLVEAKGGEFVFETRYLNLLDFPNSMLSKQEYSPVELVSEWKESEGISDIFERYKLLLNRIIGKDEIESLQEGASVIRFVHSKINEWAHGPSRTASEIIDDIETNGNYVGNCTERENLTKWLFSVGGVRNRSILGQVTSEEGFLNGTYYEPRQRSLHAWNEFGIVQDGKKFWVPVDWGNSPYIREDSLRVHYIPTNLPKTSRENARVDCELVIEEMGDGK